MTVVYHYTKAIGMLKVVHKDVDSGTVLLNVEKKGDVGSKFTTSAETISGYTLSAAPSDPTVTFARTLQTLTYEYKKNAVVPPVTPPTTPTTPTTTTTKYALNVTVNDMNMGSVLPAGGSFDANTFVALVVEAKPGYQFLNWTGKDSAAVADKMIQMTTSRELQANFGPLTQIKEEIVAQAAPVVTTTTEPAIVVTPAPVAPASTPVEEIVTPVAVPQGAPVLPKTGGIPFGIFSGLGVLLTSGGLILGRRKKDEE